MNSQSPIAAKNGKAPVAAPVLWGVRDVMSVLNCGRTKLWQLDKAGLIGRRIFIGRNPKWKVSAVLAYAEKGDVA
jgi:hypothetical protein